MSFTPQPSNIPEQIQTGNITGITYYLMQKQAPSARPKVKSLPRNGHERKVSQRSVISQMAGRLASSVYRNFSEAKKKKVSLGKLTAMAAQYLRSGLSVDETAERLVSVEC